MLNFIAAAALLIAAVLAWSWMTGRKKASDRRSAMETIACSIATIFRSKTEETAEAVRSTGVVKEEAMHEVEDAISSLKSSFMKSQKEMRLALENLRSTVIPELKDKPGSLEAKARKYKDLYEKSVQAGRPLELHKSNAMKALQHKAKALANIKTAEKQAEKLELAIESSKADYDGSIMDLQMMKAELSAMVDIPQIELSASLDRIKSLQAELLRKQREATVSQEIAAEMHGEQEAVYNTNLEAEFSNL